MMALLLGVRAGTEPEPIDARACELRDQLKALLDCSQEMLARVTAGDWEVLEQLQSRREALIVELCSKAPEPLESASVASCIQQILALDGKVAERVEAALQTLLGSLSDLDRGRRARLAYEENSG